MEQVETQPVLSGADDVVETQVTLRLHAMDHKKVVATKQDLDKVCSYLVEQYAKGGVMLRASQAHYLEQVSGMPVRTAETIISIVESGVNRHSANGSLTISYSVDPAFAQPLEDLALQQGRSVEEIVQDGMSVVLTNQWLYAINLSGGTIYLSEEQRRGLESAVGKKQITGQDLVDWAKFKASKAVTPRVSKVREEVLARMDRAAVAMEA